jgi:hypothetical protein
MLRSKKFEIRNKCGNCERANKKTECHETEPNLSKDLAMHEGDNVVQHTFERTAISKEMLNHV